MRCVLDKQGYTHAHACTRLRMRTPTRTHARSHTHTGNSIILVDFPWQMLRKQASMLHYTYIACLVYCSLQQFARTWSVKLSLGATTVNTVSLMLVQMVVQWLVNVSSCLSLRSSLCRSCASWRSWLLVRHSLCLLRSQRWPMPLSRGRNVGLGLLTPACQSVSVSIRDFLDFVTLSELLRHIRM